MAPARAGGGTARVAGGGRARVECAAARRSASVLQGEKRVSARWLRFKRADPHEPEPRRGAALVRSACGARAGFGGLLVVHVLAVSSTRGIPFGVFTPFSSSCRGFARGGRAQVCGACCRGHGRTPRRHASTTRIEPRGPPLVSAALQTLPKCGGGANSRCFSAEFALLRCCVDSARGAVAEAASFYANAPLGVTIRQEAGRSPPRKSAK